MSKKHKLTSVEWEIMEIIWKLSKEVTAREVVEKAYPNGEKAYTTVQTIMNNLHKKGLLERQKIGMVNFYSPTTTRKSMEKNEFSFFLSKVFDGSIQTFTNFLINSEKLELKDIKLLKALLSKKEKELRNKSS